MNPHKLPEETIRLLDIRHCEEKSVLANSLNLDYERVDEDAVIFEGSRIKQKVRSEEDVPYFETVIYANPKIEPP